MTLFIKHAAVDVVVVVIATAADDVNWIHGVASDFTIYQMYYCESSLSAIIHFVEDSFWIYCFFKMIKFRRMVLNGVDYIFTAAFNEYILKYNLIT